MLIRGLVVSHDVKTYSSLSHRRLLIVFSPQHPRSISCLNWRPPTFPPESCRCLTVLFEYLLDISKFTSHNEAILRQLLPERNPDRVNLNARDMNLMIWKPPTQFKDKLRAPAKTTGIMSNIQSSDSHLATANKKTALRQSFFFKLTVYMDNTKVLTTFDP